MFLPVFFNVRVRKWLPIVEIKAMCPMNISLWINAPLQLIEKGENAGGKLLSQEPIGVMKPNTVYFSMIFKTEQKAVEFAKSLQKR